jgi:hypothetical protein
MAAPSSALDICQRALTKNHCAVTLPADFLTNPIGQEAIVCVESYDDARRVIMRMGAWTCIQKRVPLVSEMWAANTYYAIGHRVIGQNKVYQCATAGYSSAAAPSPWLPGTTNDGSVVWTYLYTIQDLTTNYTGKAYQYGIPADYINQVEGTDSTGRLVDFMIEGHSLYSDEAEVYLTYIYDSTDPTKWDPLLAEAIITQLASMVAYSITGSHENAAMFARAAQGLVPAAAIKTRREKRQGKLPAGEYWYDGIFEERNY